MFGVATCGLSDFCDFSEEIPVSVGRSCEEGGWFIVPRTRGWETSQRFELSRLLCDALLHKPSAREWLVASDYKTARQKTQRAFAAEFLCPIEALDDFLGGDFTETKREKAADYFKVSGQAIEYLLLNNGMIEQGYRTFPYSVS